MIKKIKVKSVFIECPECQAKAGDWCRDQFDQIRAGYTLMHSLRLHEIEKEPYTTPQT